MGAGVGAAIGGVASIAGGIMGGNAQQDAAKAAAKAETQTAAANAQLAREMYRSNSARLDPYSSQGYRAGSVLSELLLGPQLASAPTPWQSSGPSAYDRLAFVTPMLQGKDERLTNTFGKSGMLSDEDRLSRALGYLTPQQKTQYEDWLKTKTTAAPAAGGAPAGAGAPSALSAWDQFRNGTNYQWRLGQGNEALNMSMAARGMGQSGAADKARIEYGQNFASNELANYMNMLSGQQNMGLTASSALAGVGQNLVGNVTAANNQAGSAAANAALMRGNATANMWGGIAGGVGQIAGALGSSFGGGLNQPGYGMW